MSCCSWIVSLCTVLSFAALSVAQNIPAPDASTREGIEFFESHVRPLLIKHCYECHSEAKTQGGLGLDDRDSMTRGGDSGPAIVPGHPDDSPLIRAVRHEDLKMPPSGPLPEADIQRLVEWIRMGAPDPRHVAPKVGGMNAEEAKTWWAFQPIPVQPTRLSPDAIDTAIEADYLRQGLEPSPPADPRALLRRVTYDLTGLPPTPEGMRAYVSDASPEAFRRAVDLLLESPAYGAHWGRHWLDVVRYADTAGENTDRPLVHAWRYRNWVLSAIHNDMPYDQFVRMQIAGDLFPKDDTAESFADGIIATGYLAIARRFGHDIDKDMYLTIEDVIDNVGKSFLGLTTGCARCHDHKYDPITIEDYYAWYGIFSSSKFSFPGCEPKGQPKDMVPLLSPTEVESLNRPWQAKLDAVEREKSARMASTEIMKTRWKELTTNASRTLAASPVAEGMTVELSSVAPMPLDSIAVERGDILQLTVLPNTNHGADSTRIEFQVEEQSGERRHWSTSDLISDFMSSNPRPALHDATWCYYESTAGPFFLSDRRNSNGGSDALRSWSAGSEPSVFVNASESPVSVWTSLPANSFFVHPGPNRPVSIAWVSPFQGTVGVRGLVADVHPTTLDGVSFTLEHISAPELGPELIAFGQSMTAPLPDIGPAPTIPVAYAVVEGIPNHSKLHLRGDPEKPGPEVARRWLSVLGGDSIVDPGTSGRLDLANWIAQHPLSARVMTNRVWQWHFGQGLVRTPNDFGSRGAMPSHPELLDRLTAEFIASGYSVKHLHRLIVSTKAYQRSSSLSANSHALDPENQWLSHFQRRRLTAEEIRDSLLFVSGELDLTPAREHPFPPEASWAFTQHDPFSAVYESKARGVYLMVQRQRRHPFLSLFDGADPNTSTPVRQTSTGPTQALYFMNDPFFHEQTSAIARHGREFAEPSERLNRLYWRMLQRAPSASETERLVALAEQYPATPDETWEAIVRVIAASNDFLYLD
jgi:hypothetical protein